MKRGRPKIEYLIDVNRKENNVRIYFGSITETEEDSFTECLKSYIDAFIPHTWEIADCVPGSLYQFKVIDRNDDNNVTYFYIGDRKDDVVEKLNSVNAIIEIVHK